MKPNTAPISTARILSLRLNPKPGLARLHTSLDEGLGNEPGRT